MLDKQIKHSLTRAVWNATTASVPGHGTSLLTKTLGVETINMNTQMQFYKHNSFQTFNNHYLGMLLAHCMCVRMHIRAYSMSFSGILYTGFALTSSLYM